MSVVSMKALLEAGVHFGHRTSRWNPKMRPYIFTERSGIHIIDLQQTVSNLNDNHLLRLYITYLRKKIEPDPANPQYIFTERGLGYRFVDFQG